MSESLWVSVQILIKLILLVNLVNFLVISSTIYGTLLLTNPRPVTTRPTANCCPRSRPVSLGLTITNGWSATGTVKVRWSDCGNLFLNPSLLVLGQSRVLTVSSRPMSLVRAFLLLTRSVNEGYGVWNVHTFYSVKVNRRRGETREWERERNRLFIENGGVDSKCKVRCRVLLPETL